MYSLLAPATSLEVEQGAARVVQGDVGNMQSARKMSFGVCGS
jgi:hypothetical protein